jgi:hypothetical protein
MTITNDPLKEGRGHRAVPPPKVGGRKGIKVLIIGIILGFVVLQMQMVVFQLNNQKDSPPFGQQKFNKV